MVVVACDSATIKVGAASSDRAIPVTDMGGPDDRADQPGSMPPPGAHGADYLDIREEWGPDQSPNASPPTRRDGPPSGDDGRSRDARARSNDRPGPGEKDSKRRVTGIARSVELRPNENGVETLVFRVDRYDRAGNRLTPIAVEMQARRAGRITDGDEVEVAGRWSRGTLHAGRISNLTTASEVIGYPRWLKWVVLGFFLLVFGGGCAAVASQVLPNVLNGSGFVDSMMPTAPSVASDAPSVPEANPGAGVPENEGVPVPSLIGLDQASAEAVLAASGLTADSRSEASDVVPQGQVISTDPATGMMVVLGDLVVLVVSSGPAAVVTPAPTQAPEVLVPDVGGLDDASATQTLSDLGLVVVVATEGFCFGEHTAIRTEPAAGSSLPADSTITLVTTC